MPHFLIFSEPSNIPHNLEEVDCVAALENYYGFFDVIAAKTNPATATASQIGSKEPKNLFFIAGVIKIRSNEKSK